VIGWKVGDVGTAASARGSFFDRKRVTGALSRAERRTLSRFGAYVRTRDRSSQRRRKSVSAPGAAPSAHLGLVKDLTFFVYEPARHSVVIGPARLNKPPGALRLLEEGGQAERAVRGRTRRVYYRARPHTGPAFDAELARRMPGDFKDTVRE
jgi:hypothetical protein